MKTFVEKREELLDQSSRRKWFTYLCLVHLLVWGVAINFLEDDARGFVYGLAAVVGVCSLTSWLYLRFFYRAMERRHRKERDRLITEMLDYAKTREIQAVLSVWGDLHKSPPVSSPPVPPSTGSGRHIRRVK